jgi:TrmH family RNA methyltransferase
MKKIIGTDVPIAGVVKKKHPVSSRQRGLVLDRVQDPGNVGTLLRSAVAFGFDWVVLYQCADLYSLKVVSSTQGALFQCDCELIDTLEALDRYRSSHVWLATTLDGTPEIPLVEGPLLVLLGNEGAGLDPTLIEKADHQITIATQTVESLNVAVAGSIVMYQLKK